MFSVKPSKGFLDISVKFFGSVLARFVDLSVIVEGPVSFHKWLLNL